MNFSVTPRMRECVDFIKAYISEKNAGPSYEEIAEALHLKSKSGVARLICGLKERGLIEYIPNRARTVRVVEQENAINNVINSMVSEIHDAYRMCQHVNGRNAIPEIKPIIKKYWRPL